MANTIIGLGARNPAGVSQVKGTGLETPSSPGQAGHYDGKDDEPRVKPAATLKRRHGGAAVIMVRLKSAAALPHSNGLRLLQMRVEPGYGAADAVAAMFGLYEHVAFVLVDD